MERYTEAKMEIVVFTTEDVIRFSSWCVSPPGMGKTDGGDVIECEDDDLCWGESW